MAVVITPTTESTTFQSLYENYGILSVTAADYGGNSSIFDEFFSCKQNRNRALFSQFIDQVDI